MWRRHSVQAMLCGRSVAPTPTPLKRNLIMSQIICRTPGAPWDARFQPQRGDLTKPRPTGLGQKVHPLSGSQALKGRDKSTDRAWAVIRASPQVLFRPFGAHLAISSGCTPRCPAKNVHDRQRSRQPEASRRQSAGASRKRAIYHSPFTVQHSVFPQPNLQH